MEQKREIRAEDREAVNALFLLSQFIPLPITAVKSEGKENRGNKEQTTKQRQKKEGMSHT